MALQLILSLLTPPAPLSETSLAARNCDHLLSATSANEAGVVMASHVFSSPMAFVREENSGGRGTVGPTAMPANSPGPSPVTSKEK